MTNTKPYVTILKILIFVAFLANTIVHFCAEPVIKGNANGNDVYEKINFSTNKDFAKSINVDEKEMARIAYYFLEDKGFVTDMSFGRPQFRTDTLFKSAFRPKFNIALHILGLKLYGKDKIATAKSIPNDYFYNYGLVLAIIKVVVFFFSIGAFFQIVQSFFDEKMSLITTLLYVLFPSVLLYINVYTILENIGLSLLIISFAYIIKLFKTQTASYKSIFFSAVLVLFACLIRPHILMVFVLTLPFLVFAGWYLKNNSFIKYSFVCGTVILLGHLPIFYQNYKDFNAIFLSTQPSLEFFQGHNPYARGSWQPGIWSKYEKELKPMFDSEPNLKNLDEKQEMDFYKAQSIKFIKENPTKEIELIARKTAIFFLPYNFLNHRIDIILVLTYLGFLGFLGAILFRVKRIYTTFNEHYLALGLLVIPFVASYFLNVYFFVGERWRYYSEPFMLILAVYFYIEIYKYIFKSKK